MNRYRRSARLGDRTCHECRCDSVGDHAPQLVEAGGFVAHGRLESDCRAGPIQDPAESGAGGKADEGLVAQVGEAQVVA